jgi:hypothetical protein
VRSGGRSTCVGDGGKHEKNAQPEAWDNSGHSTTRSLPPKCNIAFQQPA